jgi:hypothetical protein
LRGRVLAIRLPSARPPPAATTVGGPPRRPAAADGRPNVGVPLLPGVTPLASECRCQPRSAAATSECSCWAEGRRRAASATTATAAAAACGVPRRTLLPWRASERSTAAASARPGRTPARTMTARPRPRRRLTAAPGVRAVGQATSGFTTRPVLLPGGRSGRGWLSVGATAWRSRAAEPHQARGYGRRALIMVPISGEVEACLRARNLLVYRVCVRAVAWLGLAAPDLDR